MDEQQMFCMTFDLVLPKMTDVVNLSVFSDLHADSPQCAKSKLLRVMDERAKLDNAMFVLDGDWSNSILPGDFKRFMAGENLPELADKDDMIDALVDYHAKLFKGYPWIYIGQGNHEHSVLKSNLTNLSNRLARQCKLPSWVQRVDGEQIPGSGAYEGFLKLRFWDRGRMRGHHNSGPRATLDVAFHHGAWCGKNSFTRAEEWARSMQGARLYLFGHDHRLKTGPFDWYRTTYSGHVIQESGWLVNCGNYLQGRSSNRTTYSSKGANSPYHIGSPLIQLRVAQERVDGMNRVAVKIGVWNGDC